MTDTVEPKTAEIAGHRITFIPPTQGQFEAMIRIQKTLQRGPVGAEGNEFYSTQIYRMGTLLESLIAEKDRDLVETLVLTGKTEIKEILHAVLSAHHEPKATPAAPAKKASKARVRR